jgi:EmrB/QacA subfamily drug resistance transporter
MKQNNSSQPITHKQQESGAPSPWVVFRLVVIATFLVSLDATIVVAAFPALRADFSGSLPTTLSWVINAYTITTAALLVPAGRLADLLGRKRLFLQGLAVFLLGSLLCGLAPNAAALIAARIVQALGAALLTPASLALILQAFSKDKRAIAVSLWSVVGALAAAVGPAVGSLVIELASWRWAFLINLPVGGIAWWLARQRLAESSSPESGAGLDWFGIALITACGSLVTLGIVQSQAWGWQSWATWGSLGVGVASLLTYVPWARGRPSAAVDLSLFDDRTYRYVTLATLVFGIAFSMMFLSSFLFLMGIWEFSQSLTGLAVTPGPLMVIPVAIASGRWAARHGHRAILVSGGLLYAAAQLWLWWQTGPQPDYWYVWFPAQLVGGAAIGLLLPGLSGAAVARLPPTRFGVGGAVNNAVRQLGGVLGTAIAVLLVGAADASHAQFSTVFLVLACVGVATALLALPVNTRPVGKSTQ